MLQLQYERSKRYTYATKGRQTDDEQYLEHLRFYNKALQNVQSQLDTLKDIVLNGGKQIN